MGAVSFSSEPVAHRGIFINDEDWSLRPWAIRHFGAEEGIGTGAAGSSMYCVKGESEKLCTEVKAGASADVSIRALRGSGGL